MGMDGCLKPEFEQTNLSLFGYPFKSKFLRVQIQNTEFHLVGDIPSLVCGIPTIDDSEIPKSQGQPPGMLEKKNCK